MTSPRQFRIRFLVLICVGACAVSATLGWVTGSFGSLLYVNEEAINTDYRPIPQWCGGWVGACSAVIACLVWCRLIVPISLQRVAGIRSLAGLAGLATGALSAILLHGTLMLTLIASEGGKNVRLSILAVGLGIAAPIGMALGVIGGHLCRVAVTTERAFRLPRERRPITYDEQVPGPDFMEQLDVRSRARTRPDFRDDYDA
jgi:hypothetical protein